MLDLVTLRVAFGIVAVTALALFYFEVYRLTRSRYVGWWCLALMLFLLGTTLFLFDGTAVQVITNPVGNAAAALGSASVWQGACSLRRRERPWWLIGLGPVLVLLLSALGNPAHDSWSGGVAYLATMGVLLGLAAAELGLTWRARPPARIAEERRSHALIWLMVLCATLAAFYLARSIALAVLGPEDPLFNSAFGPEISTLLTIVYLIAVTASLSNLAHEFTTVALREQASHDPLTGVLNRAEFLRQAERLNEKADGSDQAPFLVATDLDGFKALNDSYGHAAGDQALIDFTEACRGVLGPADLIGRLGGDEFVLALETGSRAALITRQISSRFASRVTDGSTPTPTISFGIAAMDARIPVKDVIIRADVALYRAKAAGRNRALRYDRSESAG